MTTVCFHDLTKSYRSREVLAGVDLPENAPGSGTGIHGLLGRNGTGKSTLLAIMAGQLRPTSGTVRVLGANPFDNNDVMSRIVFAGIDIGFPPKWPVRAIFDIAARRWPNFSASLARAIAGDFGLDLASEYGTLSRGQRSSVSIAVALAARTELTLLDEPYLGLDIHNRTVFYRRLMKEMEEHPRTIWLATHHIAESSQVLDSFHVLGRNGSFGVSTTADELSDEWVEAIGPRLPEVSGEIARTSAAGMEKVLSRRADFENWDERPNGTRAKPADIDTVVAALIEES